MSEWLSGHSGRNPGCPELGIGIADAYHGRGLVGSRFAGCKRLAGYSVSRHRADDASREHRRLSHLSRRRLRAGGHAAYCCAASPDATDAADMRRDERHMVYVINAAKRTAVLEHLARQRLPRRADLIPG